MKLPKNVTTLMNIEKFEMKSVSFITTKKDAMIVVAKDGREFLIFKNLKQATSYAVNMIVEHDDTPKLLERLRWVEMSMTDYAKDQVKKDGVMFYLSYDQYHKIEMKNNAVAFRTI